MILAVFVNKVFSFVLTFPSSTEILLLLVEIDAFIVEKLAVFASRLIINVDMIPEFVLI